MLLRAIRNKNNMIREAPLSNAGSPGSSERTRRGFLKISRNEDEN